MSSYIKISEAAKIALHTVAYLFAKKNSLINVKEIADRFNFSEAHVYKVILRLKSFNIAKSVRGPKGGIQIAPKIKNLKMITILEAIDGPFKKEDCILNSKICGTKSCLMSDLSKKVNDTIFNYLNSTKITDLEIIKEL